MLWIHRKNGKQKTTTEAILLRANGKQKWDDFRKKVKQDKESGQIPTFEVRGKRETRLPLWDIILVDS